MVTVFTFLFQVVNIYVENLLIKKIKKMVIKF